MTKLEGPQRAIDLIRDIAAGTAEGVCPECRSDLEQRTDPENNLYWACFGCGGMWLEKERVALVDERALLDAVFSLRNID